MENRALRTISQALGSALFGLVLSGAGVNAYAADKPGADCSSCHDQAQKLEKSAHSGLPCDTCHESHASFVVPGDCPGPRSGAATADPHQVQTTYSFPIRKGVAPLRFQVDLDAGRN